MLSICRAEFVGVGWPDSFGLLLRIAHKPHGFGKLQISSSRRARGLVKCIPIKLAGIFGRPAGKIEYEIPITVYYPKGYLWMHCDSREPVVMTAGENRAAAKWRLAGNGQPPYSRGAFEPMLWFILTAAICERR
jgi:hypothetical protein